MTFISIGKLPAIFPSIGENMILNFNLQVYRASQIMDAPLTDLLKIHPNQNFRS